MEMRGFIEIGMRTTTPNFILKTSLRISIVWKRSYYTCLRRKMQLSNM